MIPNDQVKAAIVAQTKLTTSLVPRLPDGTQGIRESDWRGDVFQYPNVRISLETQTDATPDSDCTPVIQDWSVHVFSEKHSSLETDQLAGLVAVYFKGLNFTQNGIRFLRVQVLENIPAIQEDERTWRAQVRCRSIVQTI